MSRLVPLLLLTLACRGEVAPPGDVDTDDTDRDGPDVLDRETDGRLPTDTGGVTWIFDTGPCDTAADARPADLTRPVVLPTAPQDGEPLRCFFHGELVPDAAWKRGYTYDFTVATELSPDLTAPGELWSCQIDPDDGYTQSWMTPITEDCAAIHVRAFRDHPTDRGPQLGYRPSLARHRRSFTLEAWVRPDELTGALAIVATRESPQRAAVDDVDYRLAIEADGRPSFATGGPPDGCTTLVGPAPLAIERWQHLGATWDVATGQKQLFVDGHRVAACVTASRSTCTRGDVQIGMRSPPAKESAFEGWIDDVRLSAGVRWTDDFVPPRALAPDASTRMLLRMDAQLVFPPSPLSGPSMWEVLDAGSDPSRFYGPTAMWWSDDLSPQGAGHHSTCDPEP